MGGCRIRPGTKGAERQIVFWPTFARTNLYDSGMPQPGNHARASFQQRLHSAAECVAHFTLNIDSADHPLPCRVEYRNDDFGLRRSESGQVVRIRGHVSDIDGALPGNSHTRQAVRD